MAYRVPQFITIEDKFMGLITLKQMMSLLGAFLFSVLMFAVAPLPIAFILALIAFALGGAIGFVNIQGVPFYKLLPKILSTLMGTHTYRLQTKSELQDRALTEIKLASIKKQLEEEEKQLKSKPTNVVPTTWKVNPDNPYKNFPLPSFRNRKI